MIAVIITDKVLNYIFGGASVKLKEANFEVEKLTNELKRLLREKELLETMILPKSTNLDKIVVDGGSPVNLIEKYAELTELEKWKDLDEKIVETQDKIKSNMDWIDEELRILKKYDKVEQLIVYYKEIATKDYTWRDISNLVHYSESQCRRIYKKYKRKRDIGGIDYE